MATAMSIQTAAAPKPPSVEISTPRWLSGSLVLVGLLTIAFLVCSIVAVREHRDSLTAIAISSAKSIIAAETMAAALADMDADAANTLLNPQQKKAAIDGYNGARTQMTEALVDAAHNITFEGEDKAIKLIAGDSGAYDALVQASFTLQGSNSKAALDRYNSAASIMDGKLIPEALEVDKINREALDKSYSSIERASVIQKALVWITGLFALAILLRVQFFLTERMRRTLNPLCLLATLLAGVLLLYTNHALSVASHEIDVVKKDAFESIHSLWQAKAVAYHANALESRYLLDRARADSHEAAFLNQAMSISNDARALASAVVDKGQRPAVGAKGSLAEEMRNITFPGEEKSAKEAVAAWAQYIKIDGDIRSLEKSGRHDEALELCLGTAAGQSDWAFARFIIALEGTIKINQAEFDKARDRGFQALENFEVIAPVMALLVVVLAFFGVLPRIREYSV